MTMEGILNLYRIEHRRAKNKKLGRKKKTRSNDEITLGELKRM